MYPATFNPKLILACMTFFCLVFVQSMAQTCKVEVRRNINTFTQAEMDELTSAILAMKFRPSVYDPSINAYDYFVVLHFKASIDHTSAAHHSPGFNPWHRELLLRFENELRISTKKSNYTLPYWDWTDNNAFNKIFSANAFGGNGVPTDSFIVQTGRFGKQAGQFRLNYYSISIPDTAYSPRLKRHFRWLPGVNTLPTKQDINILMSKKIYDVAPWDYYADTTYSFRNYLEGFWNGPEVNPLIAQIGDGLHGRVHIFIGGNMVSNSSPNDPVFFLHHCNVDRLWAEWQDKYGKDNFTNEWHVIHEEDQVKIDTHYFAKKDQMFGFKVSFTDMFDVRTNCYRYDTQLATSIYRHPAPSSGSIAVVPNPVRGDAQLLLLDCQAGNYQTEIINSAGQILSSGKSAVLDEQKMLSLSVRGLPPGVYWIKLYNGELCYGTRMVVN
jgi:tyrosinase